MCKLNKKQVDNYRSKKLTNGRSKLKVVRIHSAEKCWIREYFKDLIFAFNQSTLQPLIARAVPSATILTRCSPSASSSMVVSDNQEPSLRKRNFLSGGNREWMENMFHHV